MFDEGVKSWRSKVRQKRGFAKEELCQVMKFPTGITLSNTL
jgi:hypothetical protein